MKSKSFIWLLIPIFILGSSIAIQPTSFNCPKYVPSVCGFVSNLTLFVGSVVVIKSEIESLLFAGTKVKIKLDDGTIRPGTLSYKATRGRKVFTGDIVRLNCLHSGKSVNEGEKVCELEFLRFDPNSPCLKNSPCFGKIPSWSIRVNQNGLPDTNLLNFD